jgi:hypothetical protein
VRVLGSTSDARELELSLLPNHAADDVSEALAKALVGAGLGVRSIRSGKASLEQVFSALTEPDSADSSRRGARPA